ncbi:ABC transporter permease [Geomicrobium sediminis]|uniref:ABC transport system permease protein n=1 Tax=Geomicrobium sediminis TaxID=1347788 RepID=A0ABS2PI33_9BACL|nr:ABC transporter permease [Geomicrobium sediminis]MBM7635093.1 putative ABC transport system permease protein [Geomicrobium sediminis]
MSFLDSVKMALRSLWSHRLRSMLTMLGIIIGVGSVITVVAIGKGGEAVLTSQFAGGGNNTFEVYYMPPDEELMDYDAYDDVAYTTEDLRAIQEMPSVNQVIAYAYNSTNVVYHQEAAGAQILAINENYYDLNEFTASSGRLLDNRDVDNGRRVVTLSTGVVEELFAANDEAVGQIVNIEGVPFEVIGVHERENQSFFAFQVDEVLLPQSSWPMLYGTDNMDMLNVQANSADDIEIASHAVTNYLNDQSTLSGEYQVLNMEEIEQGISQVTNVTTMIIGGVAGISLLVGGIGVMNIMLVSVTERTREIGLRKSLGATRGNILLQFLIESVTLTTIGGLIGIMLGAGVANTVSLIAGWPFLVSIPVVLLGVGFSMFVGIVFGLLPANKAAKLDPIEALRHE